MPSRGSNPVSTDVVWAKLVPSRVRVALEALPFVSNGRLE